MCVESVNNKVVVRTTTTSSTLCLVLSFSPQTKQHTQYRHAPPSRTTTNNQNKCSSSSSNSNKNYMQSHNTKADTYTATTANDDDHERWRLQQLWEIFVSIVSAFQLQIDFIRFGSVLRCLLSVGRLVETVGRCRRRWNEQKQTR